MLVQSGGGKVYAIIANNENFELGVLPTMQQVSTSIFLLLRLRFKSLQTDYFDPMLVPKAVLVSGIERSKNTLRSYYALNTGFTVEKVGAGFPELMAKKVLEHAPGTILGKTHGSTEEVALYDDSIRDDFVQDFSQLVESAIAPIYPSKDFSDVPPMLMPFDLQIHMELATNKAPASPFAVHDGGKAPQDAPNVKKFPFGSQMEEPALETAPAASEQEGVDEGSQAGIVEGPVEEPETTN